MSFFGELYLRSTRPFLSAETTAREVAYLERALGACRGAVADLGCGHGRHAAPLHARGPLAGRVLGLERDAASLAQREPGFPVVRGDLRALPFADGALGGAYAWYSTLFVFDDATHARILADVARCLAPGGRLVLHTVPYEHLATQAPARLQLTLPDGSLLEEQSAFDPASGWDRGTRRLTAADGSVLQADWSVRYYPLAQLRQLLETAGFFVRWAHGGVAGEALGPGSTELIIAADTQQLRTPHG